MNDIVLQLPEGWRPKQGFLISNIVYLNGTDMDPTSQYAIIREDGSISLQVSTGKYFMINVSYVGF